ncbi:MAG: hypothetical protein AB7U75_07145 [Hyphomicrobiaceae bacterium]
MTPNPALVEAIRMNDREGRLTSAGAAWREESKFGMYASAIMIIFFVGGFVCSISILMDGRHGLEWLWLPAASIIGFVATCSDAPESCLKRRGILFRRDGSVYVPYGIPFDRRSGDLPWRQNIFRSIEVRRTREHGYVVDIHTSEGDAIMIAWRINEGTARKLAVQLTKALRELREATARESLDLTPEAALAMAGRVMRGYRNGAATADFIIN